jgi:hypothetical protein
MKKLKDLLYEDSYEDRIADTQEFGRDSAKLSLPIKVILIKHGKVPRTWKRI